MSDLRLSDLLRLGNCAVCGKKQLESIIPLFYVVEVSRAGFDARALQRAAGLEMQIGPLAAVMGPDEPLAKAIDGPYRVFVHETCAGEIGHLLELMPTDAPEPPVTGFVTPDGVGS
jgi:hypothetical protein